MNNENTVVMCGFDLFFSNASWLQLQTIAKSLGGNSSFDFIQQSATYMFEQPRLITVKEIQMAHDVVRETGECLAELHGCEYAANELYLRTNPEALPDVRTHTNVVSIKPRSM